jgi:hypothetical protein
MDAVRVFFLAGIFSPIIAFTYFFWRKNQMELYVRIISSLGIALLISFFFFFLAFIFMAKNIPTFR